MRSLRHRALAAVLGGVLVSAAGGPVAAAEGVSPFIVGGSEVSQAPWAASVVGSDGRFCSGTLIAPTWVLTAKRCAGAEAFTVRTGTVRSDSGGTTYRAVDVVTASRADLALLRLPVKAAGTPARLADAPPAVNDKANAFGWGATRMENGAVRSPVLKVAEVVIDKLPSGGCEIGTYGAQICSWANDGGTWAGDEGGPLFLGDRVVGVNSSYDREGYGYQTHASVTDNRGWIRDVAGV